MREDSVVYFDPPLWQQRRSFVFDRLKQISSLLDIGCGTIFNTSFTQKAKDLYYLFSLIVL